MKSQRGVRLPNAPPTSKHKDKSKYVRKHGEPQNWREYLDMEMWEAQEDLEEVMAEHRAEREPVDDDYADERWADDGGATTQERETEKEVSD